MNRLWVKLSLAFLVVSLAAVAVVGATAIRATDLEFRQYVVAMGMGNQTAAAEALTDYYVEQGSWAGVDRLLRQLGPGAGGMGMMGRGGMSTGGPNFAVADAGGRVLASRTGDLVGETLPPSVLSQGAQLIVDGREVGVLLNVHAADAVLDPQAESFLSRVRQSLLWAALAAVVLSLLLGVVLSRLLTAPLARLRRAAHAVAAGDLTQRVAPGSRDEIGDLGRAFDDMAESLDKAEMLRKNLIADVSHELRTPLTVLQGDLQAILDGVYPLEMAQVASLYDETRLLTRLVDDLHDLALADAGQLRIEQVPLDVTALAESAVRQFAPVAEAAGVHLSIQTGGTATVEGDPDRLAQVLRNLLSNAVRHTAAGGEVRVDVQESRQGVILSIADSGSGIATEDLPYVFDRFYRGDRRGSRQGRGAGLGLAIAKQLVTAHGGSIRVESEPGAGTKFAVELPKSDQGAG